MIYCGVGGGRGGGEEVEGEGVRLGCERGKEGSWKAQWILLK